MNALKLINEVEQNGFFNGNTQNNGGGYHQPLLTFKGEYNNSSLGVIISDTSCGDFGTRYNVADFICSTCGYWCDYDITKDASYDDIYCFD